MKPRLGAIYTHFLKNKDHEKESEKSKAKTTKEKGETKR